MHASSEHDSQSLSDIVGSKWQKKKLGVCNSTLPFPQHARSNRFLPTASGICWSVLQNYTPDRRVVRYLVRYTYLGVWRDYLEDTSPALRRTLAGFIRPMINPCKSQSTPSFPSSPRPISVKHLDILLIRGSVS